MTAPNPDDATTRVAAEYLTNTDTIVTHRGRTTWVVLDVELDTPTGVTVATDAGTLTYDPAELVTILARGPLAGWALTPGAGFDRPYQPQTQTFTGFEGVHC